MALTQTIGSLLHSDQLRSLREQAEALMTGKDRRSEPKAEDRPAPVQGLIGYLPMIMEYAGLFAEYIRPKADKPADAAAVSRERGAVEYWTAARPYVLATVAFGVFGYAAYRLARHQSARKS